MMPATPGRRIALKLALATALLARVNDVLHSTVREQGTDHFDTRS